MDNEIIRERAKNMTPEEVELLRKAPYPFCSHPEQCIKAGRCDRKIHGEPWCCAD